MIAVDTNVLVRFLVRDDEAQCRLAGQRVQDTLARGENIFVPDVALVETVWVLARSYKFPKKQIIGAIRKLLAAKGVRFSSPDLMTNALNAYESGRGDFSDYVIKEQALGAECDTVVAFDRDLLAEPGFESP